MYGVGIGQKSERILFARYGICRQAVRSRGIITVTVSSTVLGRNSRCSSQRSARPSNWALRGSSSIRTISRAQTRRDRVNRVLSTGEKLLQYLMGDDTHQTPRIESRLEPYRTHHWHASVRSSADAGSGLGPVCTDSGEAPRDGDDVHRQARHPAFYRFFHRRRRSTVAATIASARARARSRRRACRRRTVARYKCLLLRSSFQPTLASTSLWPRGRRGRMWKRSRRSLCLVKGQGQEDGLRRRDAPSESLDANAVAVGTVWVPALLELHALHVHRPKPAAPTLAWPGGRSQRATAPGPAQLAHVPPVEKRQLDSFDDNCATTVIGSAPERSICEFVCHGHMTGLNVFWRLIGGPGSRHLLHVCSSHCTV